jgi:hypothetical protein
MNCPNCNIPTETVLWGTGGNNIVLQQCPQCSFTRPPNHLRITEIFAFCSVDENDQEGVIAINSPMGPMPLIAADKSRLDSLRPHAKRVASQTKIKVRLLKFSTRETVEEF